MSPASSAENDDLTTLLPERFGLDLQSFLAGIFAGDFEAVSNPEKQIFLANSPQEAVVYGADPQDAGSRWVFRGWQDDALCFSPLAPETDTPERGSVLIVMETEQHIIGFLSTFHGGPHQVAQPAQILRRLARKKRRLAVRGSVLLRSRANQALRARIHDFSPRGISFVLESYQITAGESLLATVELDGCGSCDVIVTVRRKERFGSTSSLVAATFQSTTEQTLRLQQLFQCALG